MTADQSQQLFELTRRMAAIAGATRAVESALRPGREDEDITYLKNVLGTCYHQLDQIGREINALNWQIRRAVIEDEIRPPKPFLAAHAASDYDPEVIDLSCPNPEAN